jgi:hypothetical protein
MMSLRPFFAAVALQACWLPLSAAPAAAQTCVHVSMVSHNETDDLRYGFLDTETGYLAYRDAVLQVAALMTRYGATWSHQSDWRFLEAVRAFDHGAVLDDTNGKNILRYLHEDLGFEVDAHSHESEAYNYADVVHLLEELGIPSTGVVGGFIYSPPDSPLCDWEKFRAPLAGRVFPEFSWQAEVLWGGGTSNHQGQDADVSGCWRPRDRCHFFEDDPQASLVCVGHGTLLPQLIQDLDDGVAPGGGMYTQSLMVFELDVMSQGQAALDAIGAQLQLVEGYVQQGKARWTPLRELAGIWRDDFASSPNRYPDLPVVPCADFYATEVLAGYLVTAPDGNDLWVEVTRPRRDLYPGQRFPAVVCVSGGLGGGENADWGLAGSGLVEIHFNPEGRGIAHPSQGAEDCNGFLHQDDLRTVIEYAHGLVDADPGRLGVFTRSYGITMGAGCLGRYPELPVKFLLDVEGPDESYVTCFEPWTLDGIPVNDRHLAAYDMFGHWSTSRDPSPANTAWWEEREALRYIGRVRCAYLRVQAQWDHAQPPNAQWPGFDYPPLWYPGKHAVDMINAAALGDAAWTRINGATIGNPVGGTYSRNSPPRTYTGVYAAHAGVDLELVWEMINLDLGTTGTDDTPQPAPSGPALTAYPNPFNPSTRVCYELASPGSVDLAVYDLSGRRIRTLASGWQAAGAHAVAWNGRDESNRCVPCGNYVARIRGSGTGGSTKLVMMK